MIFFIIFFCITILDFDKNMIFKFYCQTYWFKHQHSPVVDVSEEGNFLLGPPYQSWSWESQISFGTRALYSFWYLELVFRVTQVLRSCYTRVLRGASQFTTSSGWFAMKLQASSLSKTDAFSHSLKCQGHFFKMEFLNVHWNILFQKIAAVLMTDPIWQTFLTALSIVWTQALCRWINVLHLSTRKASAWMIYLIKSHMLRLQNCFRLIKICALLSILLCCKQTHVTQKEKPTCSHSKSPREIS